MCGSGITSEPSILQHRTPRSAFSTVSHWQEDTARHSSAGLPAPAPIWGSQPRLTNSTQAARSPKSKEDTAPEEVPLLCSHQSFRPPRAVPHPGTRCSCTEAQVYLAETQIRVGVENMITQLWFLWTIKFLIITEIQDTSDLTFHV